AAANNTKASVGEKRNIDELTPWRLIANGDNFNLHGRVLEINFRAAINPARRSSNVYLPHAMIF
ncbi:MAG: hypothetical protein ABI791_10620, partial [Acidobacteriota bacterium]